MTELLGIVQIILLGLVLRELRANARNREKALREHRMKL